VWHQRQDKTSKTALFKALFKALPQYFLAPVTPRLVIIAITLVQPLLLERMIVFVQGDGFEHRMQVGYALIGAFALLYGLTAVFKAWFHHSSNKLALELRSQLVDATYRKLLRLRLSALDAGKATTIINVDMQHIIDGSLLIHDVWASFITVGIAVYLLYLQIGLA
jgi:ABC-type multidrug transport system fused ATPase/permease subunit